MLKLSASYSKKVPVEGQDFSSQSYHASVELELSDALTSAEIQTQIHETFALVRTAVENELKGKPAAVATPRRVAPAANPVSVGKASNKQIKFITDLASQQGYELGALTARVRELYGVAGLYDLDKKQASALLDSL